mmetsp:Transcript_15099/g.36251  ORF Transcript_15099/g.36251 Transcript_15099/m.36251 type:complete len:111 (-) Transcript_15099:1080-1412(-)
MGPIKNPEDFEYIFGFGSIMNTSTHATWQSASSDKNKASVTVPGAVVTIKKSFGFARKWNFRSTTGFTALGVVSAEDNPSDINGVMFQVPREQMPNFDRYDLAEEATNTI